MNFSIKRHARSTEPFKEDTYQYLKIRVSADSIKQSSRNKKNDKVEKRIKFAITDWNEVFFFFAFLDSS